VRGARLCVSFEKCGFRAQKILIRSHAKKPHQTSVHNNASAIPKTGHDMNVVRSFGTGFGARAGEFRMKPVSVAVAR
jgi:hypothetical protein